MTLILPIDLRQRLEADLARAGRHETGGILMGQDLGGSKFRIEDIHTQRNMGSFAFFKRQVMSLLQPLEHFFDQTGHQYKKYNYLGEWHSHPSFALTPSATDETSMWEIVNDPDVGANFAVLLIVNLGSDARLQGRAFAYMPPFPRFEATLCVEEHETPYSH